MKSWLTKKLGEVAEFQKGKLMPNSAVKREGVTPYILIDDLRSNSYSHFTSSNQGTACKPSDILLVWDGANAGTVGGGSAVWAALDRRATGRTALLGHPGGVPGDHG